MRRSPLGQRARRLERAGQTAQGRLAETAADAVHRRRRNALPTDVQVIGAVQRAVGADAIVVCAAGGLPGELHKLWQAGGRAATTSNTAIRAWATRSPAALGVKMAHPDREVVVMVGDGSYMMMNSELATSVMLGAEAHRRRARQPRLRLHQPAADARPAAPASTTCSTHARHEVAARRSTSPRTRRRWARWPEGRLDRRARGGAGARPARAASHPGHRHRHRPVPTTEAGGAWWDVAVPAGLATARKCVRAGDGRTTSRRVTSSVLED